MTLIRIIFTTLLALFGLLCQAQQIVAKHHSFTVYYNPVNKCADSVSWDLKPSNVLCDKVPRKDAFKQDKAIAGSAKPSDFIQLFKDKAHEGAKGHLYNYEDAMCDPIDKVECFLMTNMYWQFQSFNAGDWKDLEMQEREWAKTDTLHIIAGGIGEIPNLKLPNGEIVPQYFYKAIRMKGCYHVWIMENAITSKGHGYDYWKSDLATLEKQTGLKL